MSPPSGTVTFLFTDIEGSTRLWEKHPAAMRLALARHDAIIRAAISTHGGYTFKTIGDAFCAAFRQPQEALSAAMAAQRGLRNGRREGDEATTDHRKADTLDNPESLTPCVLRVRMALHTGQAEYRDEDYFGPALNRVARLLAAGHGGQILLSRSTAHAVRDGVPAGSSLRRLGTHQLRDISETEDIYQAEAVDLPTRFPPLNTMNVAYWRGFRRVASISAVVGAILALLAGIAWQQRGIAQQREASEKRQRRLTQHQLYVSDMARSSEALGTGNASRALSILRDHVPPHGQEDLRGWEWAHMWSRAQQGDSLQTAALPGGGVTALAVSNSGRRRAYGTADGTVWLIDQVHHSKRRLAGHKDSVSCAAFSPDGQLLATGGNDGALRLWDAETGRERTVPCDHGLPLRCLAFSPDGRSVATGIGTPLEGNALRSAYNDDVQSSSTVRVWSAESGKLQRSILLPDALRVYALAFSPDGSQLAAGSFSSIVWLIAMPIGRVTARLSGFGGSVLCLAFSPDGRQLVAGSFDATLRLWQTDRHGAKLTGILQGHAADVSSVAFSLDGSVLASGGADAAVRLWLRDASGTTFQPQGILVGHRQRVTQLAFLPGPIASGPQLLSSSQDGTVRLWHATYAAGVTTLPGHTQSIMGTSLSSDSRTLATVGEDGWIHLWDTTVLGPRRAPLHEGLPSFHGVAVASNGAWVAVGTGSWRQPPNALNELAVWDTRSGRKARVLERKRAAYLCLTHDAAGRTLAASDSLGTLTLWDTTSWRRTVAVDLGKTVVGSPVGLPVIAFSPDGQTLAVAVGAGELVVFWDVRSRKVLWQISPKGGLLGRISFSPDGRFVATTVVQGQTQVWDMSRGPGQTPRVLQDSAGCAGGVAFSADGRTLAVAYMNRTVRLWSFATDPPQAVSILHGGTSAPADITFSPDGRILAAGCTDGTVKFWKATSADAAVVTEL